MSILVPLFRETEIAHALIARLARLTYPKCLLDVILVLEEEDHLTQATLAGIDLPPWVRAVVVPDGQPRTKPRAMNYALDFCQGEIIGIFDAEDAPDPDQITKIARRFQQVPQDVACLQGILDYYNPSQNWLARCFTIEYATWFRTMLPGMARLGLAIPLGGTTLYFRRDVLEALGGWDAHNVTEDADLGFRLARHGYRTEMIGTVTEEEANCRAWPWIKQRSRWLKGYMTTYLVHMRHPGRLWSQLGPRKFWGFQAHFMSALSQVLLAPVLWSFWLVMFGLPHPLDPVLPRAALVGLGSLFPDRRGHQPRHLHRLGRAAQAPAPDRMGPDDAFLRAPGGHRRLQGAVRVAVQTVLLGQDGAWPVGRSRRAAPLRGRTGPRRNQA